MSTPSEEWMPVFVSSGKMSTVVASVDSSEFREDPAAECLHRIGTATRLPSGDIEIDLFALPVKGKLLVRPPREGDARNPWEPRP